MNQKKTCSSKSNVILYFIYELSNNIAVGDNDSLIFKLKKRPQRGQFWNTFKSRISKKDGAFGILTA